MPFQQTFSPPPPPPDSPPTPLGDFPAVYICTTSLDGVQEVAKKHLEINVVISPGDKWGLEGSFSQLNVTPRRTYSNPPLLLIPSLSVSLSLSLSLFKHPTSPKVSSYLKSLVNIQPFYTVVSGVIASSRAGHLRYFLLKMLFSIQNCNWPSLKIALNI